VQKRLFLVSLGIALLTWGLSFLVHDYYRATASLLPAPEKGRLSSLGQFADVAALAGINVPGSEAARLYPSIISSDTILISILLQEFPDANGGASATLLDRLDVAENTPAKTLDAGLKKLRSALNTSFDARTGIVTLGLVLDDAQLAADVLNAVILALDKFMRTKKTTNAYEQVTWIDVRLHQVSDSLRIAEERVKNFREKNRRLADSPLLMMEQDRLLRSVQVSSTVFVELKKQYELAKLEEIKNMTIVNVLDPARVPATKIGPKRKTNAAIGFMLTFLCLSGFYVVREIYPDHIRQATRLLQRKGNADRVSGDK
jgi:uncharacterized protein involved in exopolysaccharide biosynthesis